MAQPSYPQNSAQPYGQPQQPYGQQGYPPAYGQQPYNPNAKSKTAAALLAFFLGGVGAHSFYRGQMKRGAGHLALVVLTIVLIVAAVAMAASHADASGQIADSDALRAAGVMLMAYLLIAVNGLWAFVEFIMILVSKDGSLR